MDQAVIDDDIARTNPLNGAHSQQIGNARPCANQNHLAGPY
jgi:hypothetical protein